MVRDFSDTGNGYYRWIGGKGKMLIPEGYEKIPGTSDMIMPALRPCPHRGEKIVEKSCCGLVKIMFCDLCADRTTRSKCKNCNHLYRLINHRSIQCFHDLLRSTPIINTKRP